MKVVWALICTLPLVVGCKKEEKKKTTVDGEEGLVKVELANGTGASLSLADMAPDYYGQKFWHISLRGEIDQADGTTTDAEVVIWGNEACEFPKMQIIQPHSDKPDDYTVLFEYYGIDDVCRSNDGDYLDLARESEEVNDDFNAQDYPVPPGTYTSIALNSLGNEDGRTQWEFQAGDMTDKVEVISRSEDGDSGGIDAEFDEPLEIEEGDEVTIAVTYDLSSAVGYGPEGASDASGGDNCYLEETNDIEYCVNPIVITPSVVE
jgi:hypothetical protein